MSVRTRFAPSPTGYLHVGGLRAALYNYLYARQNGGRLLLRIEDTDQTREVPGAVENLISIFEWLGLEFDEGPHMGGECGPYVQSQRLSLYREQLQVLAQREWVYPCFCSSERVDSVRAAQAASGHPPMYDRHCRKISRRDAENRIEAGESFVWRLKVPLGTKVRVQDLIRGEVDFESDTLDDQVLLKSDGFPTYHLANVIDDHFMGITHVIRGEEWLPSAPKHVLLYQAFGWELPVFAHLPLILNPDRSKMSKRSGDVAVEAYREKGILRETLINFVALLGWHPADDRELFTLEELVREFSLERVQKAGAVFDVVKLRWMNSEYLKRESDLHFFEHVRGLLTNEIVHEGESRVQLAVLALRGGAESYADAANRVREVFTPRREDDADVMALLHDEAAAILVDDLHVRFSGFAQSVWTNQAELEVQFKEATNEAGRVAGLKGKPLWQKLRAALTGQQHGPELAKLVGIWGRDRVLKELDHARRVAHGAVRT